MSGIGHSTQATSASGDARIDGILHARRIGDATLTYSFPANNDGYDRGYGGGEDAGLFAASAAIRTATGFALDADTGPSADDGFSVEGFTGLAVEFTTDPKAHVRVAQTTSDPFGYRTAWSYFPFEGSDESSDVWLSNVAYDFAMPYPGGYAHLTILHEIGHALGLEHAHEAGTYGVVPEDYDAMEYTLMSYRSYPGIRTGAFTNETWGFAQSYMMLDIAALQRMYGADFTTNSGDTRYVWTPGSGQTLVDGETAIRPAGNRIFATVWDGGGTDTYVLKTYDTDLRIDLEPGAASVFSRAQLARLGDGHRASGNIYNALQYEDDPRSLIENVRAGSGDDTVRGNLAANRLIGGSGDDLLDGRGGDDLLIGGTGRDRLIGGFGGDALEGQTGDDRLLGGPGQDRLTGGRQDDVLRGGRGADLLLGNGGADVLIGGKGADILWGGAGADVFRFVRASDSPAFAGTDHIADFTGGRDLIDLSGLTRDGLTLAIGGSFSGAGASAITLAVPEGIAVHVDLDGDGGADFGVVLDGVIAVTPGDFLL